MYTNQELFEKIQQIYPEISQCDIDLEVSWDQDKNVWTVDFKKGERHMRHYLEEKDAAACLEDEQCIGLEIDFDQFL